MDVIIISVINNANCNIKFENQGKGKAVEFGWTSDLLIGD